MINHLNIYKFSFPFIENKYEEVLFYSIFNDLESLFLYEETLKDIKKKETTNIKSIIIFFKGGKIELLFNKTEDYFIPKFQLNLFFKEKINNNLLVKIVNIFETFGIKDYIFDYDKSKVKVLDTYKLIDIAFLTTNFEKYNEIELNKFLKNINKDYIKEKLKENSLILFSFTYLIFRSFVFYKNYIDSQKAQDEINNLTHTDLNTEYISILSLSKTRLEHIDNINLVTFKNYKKMLDSFFSLLK